MDYLTTTCRSLFKKCDHDFIVAAFQSRGDAPLNIQDIWDDAGALDLLLEDDRLFQAIIDSPSVVPCSPALYFYVLTRKVLCGVGLESRPLADYVAIILMKSLESHDLASGDWPQLYWLDFLSSLEGASGEARFYKILDWANAALFITGVFPDFIEQRVDRKGAPSLSFYESVGASCYRMAEGHVLADEFHLKEVFGELGNTFPSVRQALNILRERMIFIRYPMELDEGHLGDNNFLA